MFDSLRKFDVKAVKSRAERARLESSGPTDPTAGLGAGSTRRLFQAAPEDSRLKQRSLEEKVRQFLLKKRKLQVPESGSVMNPKARIQRYMSKDRKERDKRLKARLTELQPPHRSNLAELNELVKKLRLGEERSRGFGEEEAPGFRAQTENDTDNQLRETMVAKLQSDPAFNALFDKVIRETLVREIREGDPQTEADWASYSPLTQAAAAPAKKQAPRCRIPHEPCPVEPPPRRHPQPRQDARSAQRSHRRAR